MVTKPVLALEWSIKRSLVTYVTGMSDGSVTATAGAMAGGDGFIFPGVAPEADGEQTSDGPPWSHHRTLRFTGSVNFAGHSGMLRLMIAEPWLEQDPTAHGVWHLTITDPYDPGQRLSFAQVAGFDRDGAALSCTLTADGADLFMAGPYESGTPLDLPRIRAND